MEDVEAPIMPCTYTGRQNLFPEADLNSQVNSVYLANGDIKLSYIIIPVVL